MAESVTVGDLLGGHVALDVECLDRIYLNGYVPSNLQVGGQVVMFLIRHLGYPIPSPAIFGKLGRSFRSAVDVFATERQVPVVRLGKGDRKIDVVRPYLRRQEATETPVNVIAGHPEIAGSPHILTVGDPTGLGWLTAIGSRSSAALAAAGVLDSFTGVLVRDDYNGYTQFDPQLDAVQLCNVHYSDAWVMPTPG